MNTRKYLIDGNAVEVQQELANGFLVRDIYTVPFGEDEGEEYEGDKPYWVENVFDTPPMTKKHEDLKKLEAAVEKLNGEWRELRTKISESQKVEKVALEKSAKIEQLKGLFDFIDGKVTHYVQINYSSVKIIEFKESKSEYDRDKLKLLSLFGKSNGDLLWQTNQYWDGSGSWTDVFPCTSLEEANERAVAWIKSKLVLNENKHTHSDLIKSAKLFNVEIPQDYKDAYNESILKSLAKRKEDALKNLSTIEEEFENVVIV